MSQQATDKFRMSCGAAAPLALNVSGPGWASGERRVFEAPFILVGRDERSCLRLDDGEINRRHAYLQQFGERVFCVDLGSRTGIRWAGEPRSAGWLRPEQGVQIGPFTLELARTVRAGEVLGEKRDEDWDPLQDRANDSRFLPRLTVECGNEVLSRCCLNRVLVLVGSGPACRVRLRDARVSKYHCSLLRTPQGVWLIDLLSGSGTYLNGQPLRWTLVKEGDQLQVGPYVLRVWYPEVDAEPSPVSVKISAETPVLEMEDTLEPGQSPSQDQEGPEPAGIAEQQEDAEMLRQQLASRGAECDCLREQVRALEAQLVERAELQARLEAAEAGLGELEVVRRERDQWQAEVQNLQAKLASESAEREEERQRLDQERQAVRTAETRLEEASATLQKVRDELAIRNTEFDAALHRLQETQDELARSQAEARSLQVKLDHALEGQEESASLRQQLADAHDEHIQLCGRLSELESQANSVARLEARLQDASTEIEQLRVQLREAESRRDEREVVRAECDRLREQVRALEAQLVERAELQARLEAAEAGLGELEIVRGERDQWQAEMQSLQARLASESAQREELSRLVAEMNAAKEERDRLKSEQQMAQHSAEQAWARVSELERGQTEAAAAHEAGLQEARVRWESERQALEARLQLEGRPQSGAVEDAVREVQLQAAAEREQWRQLLQGAESQLLWERTMFQEQSEQLRRQAADLQAERGRLAAQLAQAESRWSTEKAGSPEETGREAERQPVQPQAARDQLLGQPSSIHPEPPLAQPLQAGNPDTPAEQGFPQVLLNRERSAAEEQRRLSMIAQEIQAAWGERTAAQEQLPVISIPLDRTEERSSEGNFNSAPSDTPSGSAASGAAQPEGNTATSLPPQKNRRPVARTGRWRQILGYVLGK